MADLGKCRKSFQGPWNTSYVLANGSSNYLSTCSLDLGWIPTCPKSADFEQNTYASPWFWRWRIWIGAVNCSKVPKTSLHMLANGFLTVFEKLWDDFGFPSLPSPAARERATGRAPAPWLIEFSRDHAVMVRVTFAFLCQKRTDECFDCRFSEWIIVFQIIATRFQHAWGFPGKSATIYDLGSVLWWVIWAAPRVVFPYIEIYADSASKERWWVVITEGVRCMCICRSLSPYICTTCGAHFFRGLHFF